MSKKKKSPSDLRNSARWFNKQKIMQAVAEDEIRRALEKEQYAQRKGRRHV